MGFNNPYHESVQGEWSLGQRGARGIARQRWALAGAAVLWNAALLFGADELLSNHVMTRMDEGIDYQAAAAKFLLVLIGLIWGIGAPTIAIVKRYLSLRKLAKAKDDSCQQAATLARTSDAARAWRDEALARGQELRLFDLQAMRKLSDLEKRRLLISQRAAACRAAHGLSAG